VQFLKNIRNITDW